MAFQSVDEIRNFSFEDCIINACEVSPDEVVFTVDALIVKRNNSQNTNFTESYADTTRIRLISGRLLAGVKVGYKYMDANEVLISEVPDEMLAYEEVLKLPKMIEGAYLYEFEKCEDDEIDKLYAADESFRADIGKADKRIIARLGIELVDESDFNSALDSYELYVAFDKAVFNWDRYMNRVQR